MPENEPFIPTDDDFMIMDNLGDVPDAELVPQGEQQLSLAEVKLNRSEKGNLYYNFRFDSPDNPAYDSVYHMVMRPTSEPAEGQDRAKWEKSNLYRLRELKELIEACGEDPSTISDPRVLVGSIVWCNLKHEKDNKGRDRAVISSFTRRA